MTKIRHFSRDEQASLHSLSSIMKSILSVLPTEAREV